MRAFFLFIFFISSIYALDIQVDAKSAILMNAKNGKVLFEKNSKKKSYPASLTKVATALYVLEKKGLDYQREIIPSDDALQIVQAEAKQSNFAIYPPHRLEHDGGNLGIKRHERMPLWAALYGMLIYSGNDCANALAEAFSVSIPTFMNEVNSYLREIGCEDTEFLNPHGLHHPKHISTAYDLAVIAKKALENPTFSEIVSSTAFIYPKTNRQSEREVNQTNRLVKPSSDYYYPYAIGVKTGYHKRAGNTLIAAAEKGDRKLIAVLLGSSKRTSRYADAIRLFDAAFSEAKKDRLIMSKEKAFPRHFEGAKSPLIAELSQDMILTYYPSEEPESVRAFIHWNDLSLPIKKGEVVGELRVQEKDKILLSAPVHAISNVDKTFTFAIKEFFSGFFR